MPPNCHKLLRDQKNLLRGDDRDEVIPRTSCVSTMHREKRPLGSDLPCAAPAFSRPPQCLLTT